MSGRSYDAQLSTGPKCVGKTSANALKGVVRIAWCLVEEKLFVNLEMNPDLDSNGSAI